MKSFSNIIGKEIPEALKVLVIPSPETVKNAAAALGMAFGSEMSEYLSVYGAISFGPIEFNGLTEAKKNNSSLVLNTACLREAFPGKLNGLALLEDRGDGDYILCDSSDHIWFFTPELSLELIDSGMDLIDYTLQRHGPPEKSNE